MKKTLGVIGGLGPMATAFFMQMVIEMTKAETDQEHIEMLIYNCPMVPDRTGYILGESSDSPLPKMVEMGQMLSRNGAEVLAIPCITANYFYKEMTEQIPAPMIDIIAETTRHLVENGVHTVGLMATDGTLKSGLFQAALEQAGIEVVLPSPKCQEDVMHLIYKNVKSNKPAEMDRFERVSAELRENGAQVIIL